MLWTQHYSYCFSHFVDKVFFFSWSNRRVFIPRLVASCLLLPPDRPFRNFRATAKCMQLRKDGFRGTEIVKETVGYLTLVSLCLAVFLVTRQSLSPAMALAVPEDTSKLTPSKRLQWKRRIEKKNEILDIKPQHYLLWNFIEIVFFRQNEHGPIIQNVICR